MTSQGHRAKKTYTTARRNPAAAICHDNVASAATRGFQFLMITHMSAAKAMARKNQRISGKFITFLSLLITVLAARLMFFNPLGEFTCDDVASESLCASSGVALFADKNIVRGNKRRYSVC